MKNLLYIAVVLSLFLTIQTIRLNRAQKERTRLQSNQTALLNGMEHYKTADSLNAVKLQTLELSKKEMKTHESELVATLKKQGIKLKRLESVTQIKTETKIEFKAVLKDSLVYLPGKDSLVTMKCMDYRDPWIDFSGCYQGDTFAAKIQIPVNLDIIAHRVPKQFLFFKFGVKSVDIDIISLNPYTDIAYAKNIRLKK